MTASPRVRGERTELTGDNAERGSASRRLIVLTRDPALEGALEELGSAVPVLVLDTLAQLTDELMQRGAVSALLDIGALDAPVDAVVDALATQFPDLRLMVAGQAADQSLLATRISEQTVFRFVHKPASPQRLKLFVDAAFRTPPRMDERRATARPAPPSAQPEPGSPPFGGGPRSSAQTYTFIALIAVAVAGTAGWYFSRKPAAAPAATIVTAPPVAPGTTNTPDNAQLEQALRTAEAALLAGRLDEASAATEQARALEPDNPRLAFLATQIEREQARLNADSAQREAVETRQSQIRRVLAGFEQKISQGALVEPLGDSAISHLREAESIAPRDAGVLAARDTLITALLSDAEKSLAAGKPDAARRLVDVTAQVNPRAPGLDLFRRRIEEVVARSVVAPPPAEPVRAAAITPEPAPVTPAPPPVVAEARPVTPAPAAAVPAETRPADAVISASKLTTLRKVEAKYPVQAYQTLTSGWVDMEFTVTKDGSVDEVVITSSEPGRTFDSAAVSAMRRYRYAPVLRNGVAVEQRARLRMRFTATESN